MVARVRLALVITAAFALVAGALGPWRPGALAEEPAPP
jgi:hypothetical protein